ncbi:LysR family transcriptional regulator [bacterium LRH843]|nr:LysR family transcriptional regulator [bacterium LRH843]
MTLARYEVFNTVVELKSITKAAASLNLTQSAVSYSIANLESELGFPLLIRSRSGITLTNNGERILNHTRTILHWEEKMKQEVAQINGLAIGTLRIAAFPGVCIQWLPKFMKYFKKEYPSIEVKIFQGGFRDIEKWIMNGDVDFGFVALPTLDTFETIPLKVDRMLCILPPTHPLCRHEKIHLKQLEEESFVILKSGYDNDLKRIIHESGVTLNIKFEMADVQSIISMVEHELGVSIIPELVLQGLSNKISIHGLEPEQLRTIAIAAISFKEISPAARTFIDYAKSMLE